MGRDPETRGGEVGGLMPPNRSATRCETTTATPALGARPARELLLPQPGFPHRPAGHDPGLCVLRERRSPPGWERHEAKALPQAA